MAGLGRAWKSPARARSRSIHACVTVRNPVLPVDESGVFDERAALRYLLQYESWHRYEPPRITLPLPRSGPEGSLTGEIA
jgi:hypothetical protein